MIIGVIKFMTSLSGTTNLTWVTAQKHTDKVNQQHSKIF